MQVFSVVFNSRQSSAKGLAGGDLDVVEFIAAIGLCAAFRWPEPAHQFVGDRAGLQPRVLVQKKRDASEHAFVVEQRNAVTPPLDDGGRQVVKIANGFRLLGQKSGEPHEMSPKSARR